MTRGDSSELRSLLEQHSVAALGSLQNDEPYVSMVPFAVASSGKYLIIHVSRLAAHTQNMERNERVSLLISESEGANKMPQSLSRVTIQGIARKAEVGDPKYSEWREAYLNRFPATAPMFDFADFRLVLIEVTSARLVGGFAQAGTLDAADFAAIAQRL